MSKENPISLAMICKNEEGQIGNCLESIQDYVDEIVIVDTGSTDRTPEIARKYADKFEIFTDCNDSSGLIKDFSLARQRSFDLASHDWVMWVDADDVVRNANLIPEYLSKYASVPGSKMIILPYEYSHDENGNINCLHYRERIFHPRKDFRWINPVHEVVMPSGHASQLREDGMVMVHRRVQSGKKFENGRNLRILEEHIKNVGESDVRSLYYIALEYGNVGNYGQALRYHKRYMELSGWDDERFMSCMKIVDTYQALCDYDNALMWAFKSLEIKEGWFESYFAIARTYYHMAMRGGPNELRNWERTAHYGKLGLSLPLTNTILFVNPLDRNYEVHRYLNLALSKIGRIEEALDSANSGLKYNANDAQLIGNVRIYKEWLAKVSIKSKINELVTMGSMSNHNGLQIVSLLDAPHSPEVSTTASITSTTNVKSEIEVKNPSSKEKSKDQYTTSNPKDIVFYVGFGPEPWTPETIKKTGIGGSETMAWKMAQGLCQIGHNVRFYGDCSGMEGTYDGVQFIHHDKFNNVDTDVFISSRRSFPFNDSYGLKSKINMCWIHDIMCGDHLEHKNSLKIDRFLCLSQWHKNFFLNYYKFVHPSQVLVTRNGIDLNRFKRSSGFVRNPHRAVYSSSPDRGLQASLDSWHIVRNRVPDAELHIFYGFDSWYNSAKINNNHDQINLINHLKSLIKSKSHLGVFEHGRVDQDLLALNFLGSGVWAYPTWFSETSCISAMEAQAAGLRIVTSPIAALNETVGDRGVMISGDWLSPDYQSRWANSVADAMLSDDSDGIRQRNINYANLNFGMDTLVIGWDNMIQTVKEEVERDVVPQYKCAW